MPKQKVTAEEILRKSMKVFNAKGYHNTSMAQIADECGLLKGSIYHYFKSKEQLMQAVIEYLHQKYKEKVFSIAYQPDLTSREKLEEYIVFSENLFIGSNDGCLMGNIALETVNTNANFAKSLRAFFQEWINAMAHIFEVDYGKQRALEISKECVAEIEGALMLKRVFQEDDYLHKAHQRILQRGIKTKQT